MAERVHEGAGRCKCTPGCRGRSVLLGLSGLHGLRGVARYIGTADCCLGVDLCLHLLLPGGMWMPGLWQRAHSQACCEAKARETEGMCPPVLELAENALFHCCFISSELQ